MLDEDVVLDTMRGDTANTEGGRRWGLVLKDMDEWQNLPCDLLSPLSGIIDVFMVPVTFLGRLLLLVIDPVLADILPLLAVFHPHSPVSPWTGQALSCPRTFAHTVPSV